MATTTLTARFVENVKPTARRLEHFDTVVRGLALRIATSGTRSWVLMYRVHRRLRRWTIGTYPTLSLADARAGASRASYRGAGARPRWPSVRCARPTRWATSWRCISRSTHSRRSAAGRMTDAFLRGNFWPSVRCARPTRWATSWRCISRSTHSRRSAAGRMTDAFLRGNFLV